MKSKKYTKRSLNIFSVILLFFSSLLSLHAQTIITIQPADPAIGAGYPFGAIDSAQTGFGGFIYRNIPAFTLKPGDKIRFDMGDLNDVAIQRNIYFAAANINPAPWSGFSQGVAPLSWVQVIPESQTPSNAFGDSIIGNFELTYTATSNFTFAGGGFIIGFGTNPPGTYVDSVVNYDGVYTSSSDSTGFFYQRFAFRTHLTMDILDSTDIGYHDEFGILGFQLEIEEAEPPVAICKNISVNLSAAGTASITATAVDGGSTSEVGIASITVSPQNFTCANLGNNTVTLTVTDTDGNASTCTAIVTVVDNMPPAIMCKNATLFLNAAGLATLAVADVDGGSTDNCGVVSKTVSKTSFNCANIGTNTVTVTATDASGNMGTCTAIVTVKDAIAPIAICKNISVTLVSGTATITAADINNGSTDNCGIASVSIDKTTFTCGNIGSNSVILTVTDFSGNVSTCTATVTVSGVGVPPVAVCKNISITLASGTGTITAADVDGGSSAPCGIASMTVSKSTFVCADAGVNTVVLTVTDVNGNVSTCTATVTIVCCVPPVAVCKNISVTLVNGTATITPASVDGGSTATCGLASSTISKSTFTCSNIGANAVVLTVTDVNGNVSTCTSTVTVVGAIPTVSISQGILPGFCQGAAIVLTANSPTATSYMWTGGLTTNPINVTASGNYTVAVTNSYGCKKTAASLVLYNKSNLLSAYTIIATGANLFGPIATLNSSSKLLSGGLGVKSLLQTASVINGSTVTAAGTFVKAPFINTLFGGTISSKIYAQATVTLPSFKSNPYAAGPVLSVPASSTVTVNDSIFSTITIGTNAKVTFTRPAIYATGLTMKDGSSMEFTSSCQKVVVRGNATTGNNCKVNVTNNKALVVYTTGNLTLGYGNTFKGSTYIKGKLTSKDNPLSSSTYNNLTGLFIANAVDAKHTNFNWNTVCENCGSIFKSFEETTENEVVNEEVSVEETNSVSVYPNPSDGIFNVKIVSDELGTINVSITNINGQSIFQTRKENSSGITEIPVDLTSFDNGIYFLRIQMGDQLITKKIILNK